MIHYDDHPTEVDRIALSNALYDLADRFQLEAAHWARDTAHRAETTRAAGILRTIARACLNAPYDLNRGEAYYDAGNTLLGRVEGQRRFITTLHTPPLKKPRRNERMNNPRTTYVVHVIAYMILCALLLVGGTTVIADVMTGAGIGLALFGVVLWGWFVGGMAMAYWDARLREMPARPTSANTLDAQQANEAEFAAELERSLYAEYRAGLITRAEWSAALERLWPDGADRTIRHEDYCHTVTGCAEPDHCTCDSADRTIRHEEER